MLRMAITAWKKEGVRRKSQHKINNQVLKIKTYQISRLVKVVIADGHPVFDHALEGLPLHVAGERDRILLNTSHYRHPEKGKVKVAHVRDRRLPLVQGAPTVNDLLGALWARSHCVRRRRDPLLRRNVRA